LEQYGNILKIKKIIENREKKRYRLRKELSGYIMNMNKPN